MAIMRPEFPAFDQSAYCNFACEYAVLDTDCRCVKCKGWHHGRSAYFQRVEASIPAEKNVTLVSSGGFKALVMSAELVDEFAQFLKIANPSHLGAIFSVKRMGQVQKYASTEYFLKELKMFAQAS